MPASSSALSANGLLRVALLQMAARPQDPVADLAKAESFCRRAAAMGADIALFPELFSTGVDEIPADDADAPARWRSCATPADGPWVGHFRALARELGLAIACTFLEKRDDAVRNSLALIDRHGEIRFVFAKVHTLDCMRYEAACENGTEFLVANLDTVKGTVCVGAMICMDMLYPESGRMLMLKGAELILVPGALRVDEEHVQLMRTRAYENAAAVCFANYPESEDFTGRSAAFSLSGPRCDTLVEAEGGEDVIIADIDLEALRAHRAHTACGSAWRRPNAYGPLVGPGGPEVFVRQGRAPGSG